MANRFDNLIPLRPLLDRSLFVPFKTLPNNNLAQLFNSLLTKKNQSTLKPDDFKFDPLSIKGNPGITVDGITFNYGDQSQAMQFNTEMNQKLTEASTMLIQNMNNIGVGHVAMFKNEANKIANSDEKHIIESNSNKNYNINGANPEFNLPLKHQAYAHETLNKFGLYFQDTDIEINSSAKNYAESFKNYSSIANADGNSTITGLAPVLALGNSVAYQSNKYSHKTLPYEKLMLVSGISEIQNAGKQYVDNHLFSVFVNNNTKNQIDFSKPLAEQSDQAKHSLFYMFSNEAMRPHIERSIQLNAQLAQKGNQYAATGLKNYSNYYNEYSKLSQNYDQLHKAEYEEYKKNNSSKFEQLEKYENDLEGLYNNLEKEQNKDKRNAIATQIAEKSKSYNKIKFEIEKDINNNLYTKLKGTDLESLHLFKERYFIESIKANKVVNKNISDLAKIQSYDIYDIDPDYLTLRYSEDKGGSGGGNTTKEDVLIGDIYQYGSIPEDTAGVAYGTPGFQIRTKVEELEKIPIDLPGGKINAKNWIHQIIGSKDNISSNDNVVLQHHYDNNGNPKLKITINKEDGNTISKVVDVRDKYKNLDFIASKLYPEAYKDYNLVKEIGIVMPDLKEVNKIISIQKQNSSYNSETETLQALLQSKKSGINTIKDNIAKDIEKEINTGAYNKHLVSGKGLFENNDHFVFIDGAVYPTNFSETRFANLKKPNLNNVVVKFHQTMNGNKVNTYAMVFNIHGKHLFTKSYMSEKTGDNKLSANKYTYKIHDMDKDNNDIVRSNDLYQFVQSYKTYYRNQDKPNK